MKIRQGFVSNSSSSSFVLFGKVLNDEEARKAALHYGANMDDDSYSDALDDCNEIDFLYDDGRIFAGWELANGSDYTLNETQTPLEGLLSSDKIKKLKEIIGDFEPQIITGERYC